MAVFASGFELGDIQAYIDSGWTVVNGSGGGAPNITTTNAHQSLAGRGGSYCFNVGNVQGRITTPNFGTTGRWANFYFKMTGNNDLIVTFYLTGTAAFSVTFNRGAGTVYHGRGTAKTLETGPFINGQAGHWISIEANLANAGGQVTTYINGVQVVQTTGDTTAAGSSGFDSIRFYSTNGAGAYVDDLLVTTTAEGQLGEHFIEPFIPDANDVIGSGAGSTGGAGSFANVDEIPPDGGTSYNEFTAPGTDRYATPNLGYTPGSIHCVTVMAQAARDGTITSAQTVCATDTGGGGVTEALGVSNSMGAAGAYVGWQDTFNVDPDTTAAWTSAGLDDLRVGIKFA